MCKPHKDEREAKTSPPNEQRKLQLGRGSQDDDLDQHDYALMAAES